MSNRRKFSEWVANQRKTRYNLAAFRAGIMTLGVLAMAPAANAQSSTSSSSNLFPQLTTLLCGISSTISGPWLYVVAIVCVIVGAIGIANAESTIVKYIVGALSGLGFAASAGTIVATGLGITASCTTTTA